MIVFYAVEIKVAGYTGNGASQRGWLVYTAAGELAGFLDQDGRGDSLIRRMYGDTCMVLASLHVPAAEYRTARRGPQITYQPAPAVPGTPDWVRSQQAAHRTT